MLPSNFELPPRMKKLPRDPDGNPIPWFAQTSDGQGNFSMDPYKWMKAVEDLRCWICGEQLGTYRAFMLGPLLAVGRTAMDPPSHRECAEFWVQHFPLLSDKKKQNPSIVMMIWITRKYALPISENDADMNLPGQPGGPMFSLGEPEEVLYYCQGRPATREEIRGAMEPGISNLRAKAKLEGPESSSDLEELIKRAEELMPDN
jgi:hypothetical protein